MLVVCHANCWRSPLAYEVLAAELVTTRIRLRSGGVRGHGFGRPAARPVRLFAAEVGLDLSSHRSRGVTTEDLAWATTVVYMDDGNLRRLLAAGAPANKLRCLADALGDEGGGRVPDPAFLKGGERRAVFELVVRAARALAAELTNT